MMLLPVTYQNKELELEFDIQRGYVTRVGVKVGDVVVIFEPDEEGGFRALTGGDSDQAYNCTVNTSSLRSPKNVPCQTASAF